LFYPLLFGSYFSLPPSSVPSIWAGEYSRNGQKCDGKACGAALAGLQHCLSTDESGIPSFVDLGADPFDYQMNIIKVEIYKRLDAIMEKDDADSRQAELAYQMFDVVEVNGE
jgi:hypothetical protein